METRTIATMVMRILILVSSCYLISCGGHMRTYDDNFSLYGDSSINQFVLRDTSSFASINNMPKIIDDFNIGEFIGFSNASSTEFVLLVREYGGLDKQFDYFYLTDSIPQEYVGQVVTLPDSSFHTTLGAYIGCSEKEFCDKYRKLNFSVSRHTAGNTYTFQDSINLYRSVYKFTHGYLSYVEFGYVW